MIYFLVNNNYHLHLDLKLAKQLPNAELGLIQIPYSLNVIQESVLFRRIYNYPIKLVASIKNLLLHPKKIKSIIEKVDNELIPQNTDILLVHTEMDLLNQHIIKKFFDAGSKIFLLEDGTATICHCNMSTDKLDLKYTFRSFLLRHFYNFDYLNYKNYGVETLPEMCDYIFNGVILNHGNSINRNITLYKLKPVEEPIDTLNENDIIFFSQAMYLWYLSEEEYVIFIENLLSVSKNFNIFYFKFHPSDNENVKNKIVKIIDKKYPNVIVLYENDIAESTIEKYPTKFVLTINSTAALNIINRGVVPIFINNIFNDLYPNKSFTAFGQFLNSINCNSPKVLQDINPGFIAFINDKKEHKKYSLIDIINND